MHTGRSLLAVALAVLACGNDVGPTFVPGRCINLPRPPSRDLVRLDREFSRIAFDQGIDLAQSPIDPDRWYLATQDGVLYSFTADSSASVVLDLRAEVATGGEAGLLGVAFHPDFAGNGHIYVSYTAPGAPLISTIARYTSHDGGRSVDPASAAVLLTVAQPYTNHNGGHIAFGPDGLFYFGLGDGGSSGDPQGNAQNPDTLLGKMLRVDVDGAAPYAIPVDNPYAGGGGRPEIFASGLRNPWRFGFDRTTGDLWAGDVGQNTWEEVDRIELGKNYGWDIKEGPVCFERDDCDETDLEDPIAAYRNISVASVIAGTVYRGKAMPELSGLFIYADFYSGTIWGVAPGDEPIVLAETGERGLSAFAEDADGELHVVNYFGSVFRLGAAAPGDGPGLPTDLADTACVDLTDPSALPEGAIRYDLNVPFWSDGADKERWFLLPDDQEIRVESSGDWTLPRGSVVVKNFRLAGALIETRLLVRHDDGEWAGYTYEWNDDGTAAILLDDALIKQFGDQTWTYPSRTDCLYCHTAAAGRTLGLETAQLARTVDGVDQLDRLVELGALADRPAGAPLPPTDGPAPLAARARAYFHANCSHCHRPDAPGGRAKIDLRFTAPAAEVGLCDANPRAGDLDIADARLVAPGDPARSIVSARMHTLGSTRMPGLASARVDESGVDLVDAWISGLTACP